MEDSAYRAQESACLLEECTARDLFPGVSTSLWFMPFLSLFCSVCPPRYLHSSMASLSMPRHALAAFDWLLLRAGFPIAAIVLIHLLLHCSFFDTLSIMSANISLSLVSDQASLCRFDAFVPTWRCRSHILLSLVLSSLSSSRSMILNSFSSPSPTTTQHGGNKGPRGKGKTGEAGSQTCCLQVPE